MPGSADRRGQRPQLQFLTGALVIGAAFVVLLAMWFVRQKGHLDNFVDQDFVAEYSFNGSSIGTALRVPNSGILGGKARYFVVINVDSQGRLLDTLYEGPGGYPDAPQRPSFVSADGPRVVYDIPEEGRKTFVLAQRPAR